MIKSKRMAPENTTTRVALALIVAVFSAFLTNVESIGVCNGLLGDNLPEASEVVSLYQSYGIEAMRLYNPDNNTLNALTGTNISVMVGVPNEVLELFAYNATAASEWVDMHIVEHYGVNFTYIAVGNEIMGESATNILPAMTNIHNAILSAGLSDRIKVSTSLRFDVLSKTSPPSNSIINASFVGPIIQFLASTGGPMLINIYPYFSYENSNGTIQLDFALFTSSETVVYDNGYEYQNLFDAMVDSVYYAIEKAGYSNVKVIVSETGWPSYGGVGTTPDYAQIYNQNLINHVAFGTPKRSGKLETYLFAMFNENQKGGDEVERNFGLFYPDQSPVYVVDFTNS